MDKNKKKYKGFRNLKCIGDCVEPGEKYLHPITLFIVDNLNNETTCASKFHLDKKTNENKYHKKCIPKEIISNNNLKKFMALPYLNLGLEQLLGFYDIVSIDNLVKWIDEQISENKTYPYTNRMINTWIKVNHETLIDNNELLVDIYIKIVKKYFKIRKVSDSLLEKEIRFFISKWLKDTPNDDFKFNLGNDLNKYLSKKL